MSSRLAGVRTRSRQFCERKVFRLGFAGYQVRSRDGVDISEVPFGLQDLIPCRWWMLGGKMGSRLPTGALKGIDLGPEEARIRCRLRFAG